MRNTWLMMKNYFGSFLHNIFNKKNDNLKNRSAILFVLALGAIFVFMFTSLSINTTNEALKFGEPVVSLYLTASMSLLFVILMTITKSTAISKNNDDELLLSLPVSKTSIVCAKVFYDYLFDFAVVLLTLLPSFIVYVCLVPGASVFIIIRGLIVIITLPMLSSALGYFLSLFFSFLSRRFKHYGIIQSIITVFILILFLAAYYGIAFISTNSSVEGTNIIIGLEPVQWIVKFINNSHILSLIYILLCTIVPFILCIIVKARLLGVTINKYKTKKNTLTFKESSATYALFKREASRYFSIPVYVINTIFGGILLLIIGIILVGVGTDYIDNLLVSAGVGSFSEYYFIIVFMIMQFSLSTISLTSSSISLEGKTLWILQAHPVSTKDIFKAKVLFNVVVAATPSVITSVLISIALGYIYLPFLIIVSIISSYIVSTLGLFINLMYPKLEWENVQESIKQSISVLISMGLNLIVLILPIVVYFLLHGFIYEILLQIIIIGIYILIAFIFKNILYKKGSKLFYQLKG